MTKMFDMEKYIYTDEMKHKKNWLSEFENLKGTIHKDEENGTKMSDKIKVI